MKNNIFSKVCVHIAIGAMLVTIPAQTWAAGVTPRNINLKDAVDTAISANTSIKLIDDRIKLADTRYQQAVTVSKDAAKKYWGSDITHIANKKEEILYPLQRENDLNELKWEKDNTAKQLQLDITKLYNQILIKQKSIDLQVNAIKSAKDQYSSANSQVQAGVITQTTLLPLDIAIQEAETTLATLQRDKAKLVMDLDKKVGLDINQPLALKYADIPHDEFTVADITKLVGDVVSTAHSVIKLENDKMLDESEYDILESYSATDKPAGSEDLEDKILNLGYSIRDEKIAVEYKIRSDYNNILNLFDDITIKKMDYDKTQKLMEVAKVKYDIGNINFLDYMKALSDTDNASEAYEQSWLDYYTAVLDFKNYTGQ